MTWAIRDKVSKFQRAILSGVFVFFGAFLITYLFANLNNLAGETHARESQGQAFVITEGVAGDLRVVTKIPRP